MSETRVSIRRSNDSLEGKVINYLKSNPLYLDKEHPELITSTLLKHWLPLALYSQGVVGEELRQVAIWAINELEAQASAIREICSLGSVVSPISTQLPTTVPVAPPQTTPVIDTAPVSLSNEDSYSSQVETEMPTEDEDEQLMDLELTEEMIQANKAFSVEPAQI
ncbi:hypothetical protein LC609_28645 [Nostoc sp. XA013]|nr:hypothetical protein [Nostoc sp. XA013]